MTRFLTPVKENLRQETCREPTHSHPLGYPQAKELLQQKYDFGFQEVARQQIF